MSLSAIGLEPADAPAELLRQGVAVRRAGDQRAQRAVALVVAALDGAGHPDAVRARLRSSSIDHGSHGNRSSGGRPPFSAHAMSHASSQRRTSMPFKAKVPITEYISAVNGAPVSLSEPKLSRLPMTGPLSARSAASLSIGTCGRSMKTRNPSRWFTSERNALPSRASGGRAASSRSAPENSSSTAAFSSAVAAVKAALLRQSVYGRLAGYENVNDADRLGRDPAMRRIDQPDEPLRDRVAVQGREPHLPCRPVRALDRPGSRPPAVGQDHSRYGFHRQPDLR